jgi:hypothetical protein
MAYLNIKHQKVEIYLMNKGFQISCKWKFIILVAIPFSLSGCTLNVNLNVSTDKPIAVNLVVDKPIEVKLGANVAVTKLPPIQADANIAVTRLPPIQADAKIGFTTRLPATKAAP